MAYKLIEGGGVTTPKGFLAGACYVGVKSRKSEKPDVAIIYSEQPASCAAMFTTNKFCAAPVILDREILKKGKARAVVINSGNANAATGEQGIKDAKTVETEAEKLLGLGEDEVFVCSTGVIGQKLPVEKVLEGVRRIVPDMSVEKGTDAAWAIMTTDLVKKEVAYELELSGGTIRIGACAKGSGMIHPNMATMLAYITTDAKIDAAVVQPMLKASTDKSFNMMTVDGDTSTNDSLFLLANGASGVAVETEADKAAFAEILDMICMDMARRIASDGEGATHLMIVAHREGRQAGGPVHRRLHLVQGRPVRQGCQLGPHHGRRRLLRGGRGPHQGRLHPEERRRRGGGHGERLRHRLQRGAGQEGAHRARHHRHRELPQRRRTGHRLRLRPDL